MTMKNGDMPAIPVYYSTIIDAVAERIRAEKELHGEYSRLSSSNRNDALLAELERTNGN